MSDHHPGYSDLIERLHEQTIHFRHSTAGLCAEAAAALSSQAAEIERLTKERDDARAEAIKHVGHTEIWREQFHRMSFSCAAAEQRVAKMQQTLASYREASACSACNRFIDDLSAALSPEVKDGGDAASVRPRGGRRLRL